MNHCSGRITEKTFKISTFKISVPLKRIKISVPLKVPLKRRRETHNYAVVIATVAPAASGVTITRNRLDVCCCPPVHAPSNANSAP